MTAKRPVLISGTHRSGSTWVGQMLSLSGELAPVHEPFNPVNRWSWLSEPAPHWYLHLNEPPVGRLGGDLQRLIELDYPFADHLGRIRSARNAAALCRNVVEAARWRRQGRTLLMKDPLAFFLAPLLAEHYGFRPVLLVRHPAAFVSSLKRLDWQFDFSNWSAQDSLLSGPLADHRDQVRELASRPGDVIDQGVALWSIMNGVVLDDYRHRDDWLVIRYEDLAADPIPAFESLYAELGLTMSTQVFGAMAKLTEADDGQASDQRDHMAVRRDSQAAMWTWLQRLTPAEIERVRTGTEAVSVAFYSDLDWGPTPQASAP